MHVKFYEDAEEITFSNKLALASAQGLKLLIDALESFNENSESDFADAIRAVISNRFTPSELADEFKVSQATICRWKTGHSCPLPYARGAIIKRIRDLLWASVRSLQNRENTFVNIAN